MKSWGIIVHPSKPEARQALDTILEFAKSNGITVIDAQGDGDFDVVLAVGGDGTILRASRIAIERDVPLLGINVGRFRFLSGVNQPGLERALKALADEEIGFERRMIIETEGPDGKLITALNEIIVERSTQARVIRIRVSVDSESIASYTADGFIVATPTGSTAYSFSAGGPVVDPELEAMVLTPVSAHYPVWRSSLVVDGSRNVELLVLEGTAQLAADGEPMFPVEIGRPVVVRKHARSLRMITVEPSPEDSSAQRFYRRLRARFSIEANEGEDNGAG
jgi:NAD+ kinase